MMDAIRNILESPAGSFGFVFSIMVLAGWIIHYVTKFTAKILTEHGQIDRRMDRVEINIDEIRTDIAEIKGSLRFVIENDRYTRKKSPLSLTDEGRDVATSNNLDVIINDRWDKISETLKGLKTGNPYDLQEFCIDTAFADTTFIKPAQFFSAKEIDKLKIISYRTGIPLLSITRIMGVLIRDRFFSENGIDLGEVDQHDPKITPKT